MWEAPSTGVPRRCRWRGRAPQGAGRQPRAMQGRGTGAAHGDCIPLHLMPSVATHAAGTNNDMCAICLRKNCGLHRRVEADADSLAESNGESRDVLMPIPEPALSCTEVPLKRASDAGPSVPRRCWVLRLRFAEGPDATSLHLWVRLGCTHYTTAFHCEPRLESQYDFASLGRPAARTLPSSPSSSSRPSVRSVRQLWLPSRPASESEWELYAVTRRSGSVTNVSGSATSCPFRWDKKNSKAINKMEAQRTRSRGNGHLRPG